MHVLVGHGEGSGRHHLDEIDALADLLAHRVSHAVGTVSLVVHPRERPPTRRGRRHDLAAEDEPRAATEAERDRLPQPEQRATVAAEIAHRRNAPLEHLARCMGERVLLDVPYVAVERRKVHMGVDEAGKQCAPLEVDNPRVGGRRAARDVNDSPLGDRHRGGLPQRSAGPVDHTGALEREQATHLAWRSSPRPPGARRP